MQQQALESTGFVVPRRVRPRSCRLGVGTRIAHRWYVDIGDISGCEAFIRESCEAQRRRPRFLNQWPPNAQCIYQGYVNTDFQQWIALLPPHWRSADAVSE